MSYDGDYDKQKEYEPVEFVLSGNHSQNEELLSHLEMLLQFCMEALRNGGQPDLDWENIKFEVTLDSRLILRLPKKPL